MKVKRKIIEIDEERCDGCGQCVISCAEGALKIIDGKAKLVSEVYCDGLGACIGECPQDALHVVEREAEEFDPEAVEAYLEKRGENTLEEPVSFPTAGTCPSQKVETFQPSREMIGSEAPSALAHWPVQIRLVPPNAPFLEKAHLLIAADCVPVAYGNFHKDFLQNKVVMIGCPKFDDVQEYLERFEAIFQKGTVRSVTVLSMEVPCCSALIGLVRKAMRKAPHPLPLEEVVIGSRGQILERHITETHLEDQQGVAS